ncbi:hypothetical protein [Actinacidiphila soli]|uniref:hypothetical protein n=1 Tax=Actinacidiphila soli TaxID=2487275 RepID=UPI000FCA65BE|nr:hypothetical protein [Actinacidiphila soli]
MAISRTIRIVAAGVLAVLGLVAGSLHAQPRPVHAADTTWSVPADTTWSVRADNVSVNGADADGGHGHGQVEPDDTTW